MLILHPDSAVHLADELHRERLAASERARQIAASRARVAPVVTSNAARQLAGRTFIRIGSWLLGPVPAPAY
jgi:hypothetical protein